MCLPGASQRLYWHVPALFDLWSLHHAGVIGQSTWDLEYDTPLMASFTGMGVFLDACDSGRVTGFSFHTLHRGFVLIDRHLGNSLWGQLCQLSADIASSVSL